MDSSANVGYVGNIGNDVTWMTWHTTSATDLRGIRCTQALHPYSCSRFLLPLGVTSVLPHISSTSGPQALGYSGSTSDARDCSIAWISSASDFTQLHRLSIYAYGSIGLVSISRPQLSTSSPSWLLSLYSAVGCRHSVALGLCLWKPSIITARISSSVCHNSSAIDYHHPFGSSLSTSKTPSTSPSAIFLLRHEVVPFSEGYCHSCVRFVPRFTVVNRIRIQLRPRTGAMTRPQRSPEVSAEIESTRSSIVKASSTRQPVAQFNKPSIPA
ncbi:hypothetical protein DPX16_1136 [Anabarilius grahami]|uniref:Uncharacterized protein n=1 Tax=Anabarilius grahami TaxID=495550 RepID=A0A3N0XZX7_ANAGA|nr:hypothetical protein DPX16_1136 [Anabarilius grahami]